MHRTFSRFRGAQKTRKSKKMEEWYLDSLFYVVSLSLLHFHSFDESRSRFDLRMIGNVDARSCDMFTWNFELIFIISYHFLLTSNRVSTAIRITLQIVYIILLWINESRTSLHSKILNETCPGHLIPLAYVTTFLPPEVSNDRYLIRLQSQPRNRNLFGKLIACGRSLRCQFIWYTRVFSMQFWSQLDASCAFDMTSGLWVRQLQKTTN